MIELIWGILNILNIVSFFFVLVEAIKNSTKSKFKTVFLFVGILALMGNKSNKPGSNVQFDFHTKQEIHQNVKSNHIIIDESLLTKKRLYYNYVGNNNTLQPISASASISGFISGIEWQTISIDLKPKIDHFEYQVIGIQKWKLMGITLYISDELFKGKTSV